MMIIWVQYETILSAMPIPAKLRYLHYFTKPYNSRMLELPPITNKFHRKSIRFHDYDYSSEGWYFITLCTHDKKHLFGRIINNTIELNHLGIIVKQQWLSIQNHFNNIKLGEFIIMPNHLHGIVWAQLARPVGWDGRANLGRENRAPTGDDHTDHLARENRAHTGVCDDRANRAGRTSLGKVVAFFKYQSTKQFNDFQNNEIMQKLWQRNYYEHIIRGEYELYFIQEYIKNNPLKWNEHIL